MQIVINLSKKAFQNIMDGYVFYDGGTLIYEAVRNGTVLPEQHGRLIDADKFQKDNYFEKRYGHDFYSEFQSRVKRQLTIIEADKAEGSDKE